MCTVLLRLLPDAAWPVQLAFVRDEDRSRPSDPPGRWWTDQPTIIGGRDGQAGGTWLALDDSPAPAIALLTDRYDPTERIPDPEQSPTRGRLPLLALERGDRLDLDADAPGSIDTYQPFHLASIRCRRSVWTADLWSWTGTAREQARLAGGDHVIASRATTLPGELARREHLLEQLRDIPADAFASNAPVPAAWASLLDARDVAPDQLDQLAIHSVTQRPGFGTVGASLVAISHEGQVRYAINDSSTLDPAAWTTVER
jgi:hypothetical protein